MADPAPAPQPPQPEKEEMLIDVCIFEKILKQSWKKQSFLSFIKIIGTS